MNAHQVRRSLAFSRREDTKIALGSWGLTVYNWCRPHRSLRLLLNQPVGKKSSSRALRRWHWALLTRYGQSRIFCSRPCSRWKGEIISCQYLIYWKYHIKKEFHYARQQ